MSQSDGVQIVHTIPREWEAGDDGTNGWLTRMWRVSGLLVSEAAVVVTRVLGRGGEDLEERSSYLPAGTIQMGNPP